jgi:hypothetical protein
MEEVMRYFFDIDDGERKNSDQEGLDLPNREAARQQAVGILPDIAREVLPDGDRRTFVCRVRDGAGKAIFEARLELIAGWLDEARTTVS